MVLVTMIVIILILLIIFLVTHRKTALPNEVLIISGAFIGGKHSNTDNNGNKVKLITNGGSFILPILQKWDMLSLNTRTLEVATPEVYTQQGVPIKVNGVVILKIGSTLEEIATAAEQFLGKEDEQINGEATEVLEGHLRAILGTMTVEDIYQNRDAFAEKVQDVASSDLAKMGLQIVSFTIKDIGDPNGYLDALGKKQIAEVKKNAAIAEAQAARDTRIEQAAADQEAQQQEIARATEVADAQRNQQVNLAEYQKQQETAQAQAQAAIIIEQMKAKQIQKEKDIELAQKDADLKEKELNATVYKQADAKLYQAKQDAEAAKAMEIAKAQAAAQKTELESNAQALATQKIGQADADKVRAMGLAEAEATRAQAEAAAALDAAGKYKLLVEQLPDMIAAAMKPYSDIEHLNVYAAGDMSSQTAGSLTASLDMLNGISGLDVRGILNQALSTQAGTKAVSQAVSGLKAPAASTGDLAGQAQSNENVPEL